MSSDPVEEAFVDVTMLVIGGTVLAAGFLAVAIFRAVAGAMQPEPEPYEYDAAEEDVPW
jgi:hypothetical protein